MLELLNLRDVEFRQYQEKYFILQFVFTVFLQFVFTVFSVAN